MNLYEFAQKKMKDTPSSKQERKRHTAGGREEKKRKEEEKRLTEMTLDRVDVISKVGIRVVNWVLGTRRGQHLCLSESVKHPVRCVCLEGSCGNQRWGNKYHPLSRALRFNSLTSQKPELAIFCGQEAKGEESMWQALSPAGHSRAWAEG